MKIKANSFVFIALLIVALPCTPQTATAGEGQDVSTAHAPRSHKPADTEDVLILLEQHDEPVITRSTPGAEENKYGFEGGSVVKVGDTYHLATSEMVGDPDAVKMKLAHWTSRDRIHWTRVSTLYESSGECDGKDPRGALWAPMPIYDEAGGRWNLFYVAYNCLPDTPIQWRANYDGRIWRAISKRKGMGGIDGPYEDVGVILQPDSESEAWEGLQGTDSFYAYPVGNLWYGFYGSANTEKMPCQHWRVGLAKAPSLAGPWKRVAEMNPVTLEPVYTENPIVMRASDGTYIAVYDRATVSDNPTAIGYSVSPDGIHWSKGAGLELQPGAKGHWAKRINTPLGLVAEGNDTFTLFYTGVVESPSYENIGFVTVRLEHRKPGPGKH